MTLPRFLEHSTTSAAEAILMRAGPGGLILRPHGVLRPRRWATWRPWMAEAAGGDSFRRRGNNEQRYGSPSPGIPGVATPPGYAGADGWRLAVPAAGGIGPGGGTHVAANTQSGSVRVVKIEKQRRQNLRIAVALHLRP